MSLKWWAGRRVARQLVALVAGTARQRLDVVMMFTWVHPVVMGVWLLCRMLAAVSVGLAAAYSLIWMYLLAVHYVLSMVEYGLIRLAGYQVTAPVVAMAVVPVLLGFMVLREIWQWYCGGLTLQRYRGWVRP